MVQTKDYEHNLCKIWWANFPKFLSAEVFKILYFVLMISKNKASKNYECHLEVLHVSSNIDYVL